MGSRDSKPVVSVVMGVHNGAAELPGTLKSVLAQREVLLELIVVDDGSSDDTNEILRAAAARDRRLRVLQQDHQGLTAALIAGCAAADGKFIARHDCGDISSPDRLRLQLDHHLDDPRRVLISCATQFRAPGGEEMHISRGRVDDEEMRALLLNGNVDELRGLSHHGTAFFPREIYEKVGGYRGEFKLAQDIDLWIRMACYGSISFVQSVLYEATVKPGSLSLTFRRDQIRYASAAIEMRNASAAEQERLLKELGNLPWPSESPGGSRRRKAEGYYFIGRALRASSPKTRRRYFWKSIAANPLLLRAWIGLLRP